MIFYTVVVGDWTAPDSGPADGLVVFDLGATLSDTVSGETVGPLQRKAPLSLGVIAQSLAATDSPDLDSTARLYWVDERIVGASPLSYAIAVPHLPAGARLVSDAVAVGGSPNLTSATAAFSSADVGKFVFCPPFPLGAVIESVLSPTVAVLGPFPATTSASGQTAVIGASVQLSALRPIS